jgi:ubiquinone/menaquinone biosynthesis C-methylase UbiE
MSTYILMKILESSPCRYDRGIRLLSFGKIDKIYDRLSSHIRSGQYVLDIGCGTGALSLRAALNGATVKAIDVNSQMLEIARKKADEARLLQNIQLVEMGVAELGNEKANSYDIVMSGLCCSELTDDELMFTLFQVNRILKPGGRLLVADEVLPDALFHKIISNIIRIPLKIITYLLTQTTTHAIKKLPQKISQSGLEIQSIHHNKLHNFTELVAKKPGDE